MKSNIGVPFFSDFPVDNDLEWQMSRAEKYCLINLLQSITPSVAIEIGTYKGGSLQVLNQYAKEVYSLDISKAPKEYLTAKFPKVHFKVGDSFSILTDLFIEIEKENKKLEFILVDGDHTTKAVKRDLHTILSYPHKNPITIILHDSFNPQCRAGIKGIDYAQYPQVKYVELDFITGSFWHNNTYREMWGGFAMIQLDPTNTTPALIMGSQEQLFKRAYLSSTHLIKDRFHFLAPVKSWLFKKLGLKHKIDMYENFD
jgi:hypothetical protein